jgi:diguanylate cyclase (GGDEF)-like protein/PAS domain S-box-containing protein
VVDRLREEHAAMTRILGAIEEYVYSGEFLADDSYVVRFAGPCRERFLGLDRDAVRDAVWVDFVHPDDRELFDHAHAVARESGRLDVEYRLRGADGRVRWVRDRGRMREIDGRVFLDGSVLDVTTLRETQERLTEHVRDIEVLGAAHAELARSSDPLAARRAACWAVRTVCGAASVGLYEREGADLVLSGSDGRLSGSTVVPLAASSGTSDAFEAGERRFVPDAGALPSVATVPADAEDRVSSVLFEPVLHDGRTVGVMTVVWADPVEALPPRVAALLPLLVDEVAAALVRARLVDELALAARTDSLTDLPNRRSLDELLPRERARATASGSPLCLAVLDLDRFKAFNDTFGHLAGDQLLRQTARRWTEVLRGDDTLVRFGGEEFVVVMPQCRLDEAELLLDRVRRATPMAQTCSAGVVCWDGVESADELLSRADLMMYAAKRAGRDRVVVQTGAGSEAGAA